MKPSFKSCWQRGVHLRCPHCGEGKIYSSWLRMYHDCPRCGLTFYRESGYYVGAMIVNYGVTAAIVLTVYLVSLLLPTFWRASTDTKLVAWFCLAIAVSLLLFRHCRSLWLALDYWLDPWMPE